MRILPAKSPDTGSARRFDDGHMDDQPADLAMVFLALLASEFDQTLIRNRLHETVPQEVQ